MEYIDRHVAWLFAFFPAKKMLYRLCLSLADFQRATASGGVSSL